MSERELVNLIFSPGFSTAKVVTNVSGRGVGMDVVKTNIEKIGGTIDVQSAIGAGTTFRIKIPLTLAIIPALTITCAGDRYAIPQVSLVELVRLEGEQARTAVEHISGTPVYRLRGNLLPLVYLDEVMGLAHERPSTQETVYIVVLSTEDRQFGLVVDDVLNTEEIVVKPLSSQLKAVRSFAGATILGDGRVALILDILDIAQQAHVLNRRNERSTSSQGVRREDHSGEREALLIVAAGSERRLAIPLSMVTRLEEFPQRTLEHVGSREVVQYRGQILPLVRLSSMLGTADFGDGQTLQVIVYSEGGRSVGLVVDEILDIVEEAVVSKSDVTGYGSIASAVVQQRITEMLDVQAAILSADPNFYDAQVVASA
jgi:two-component system chemotaxis sensor kinase CheA